MHSAARTLEGLFSRSSVHSTLWALAVLLFGIADVVSTVYLLATSALVEGNPVLATAIDAAGIWILVPVKILGLGAFYGLYRVTPRKWRSGVPIGLVLVGGFVSVWNLHLGLSGATLI